MLKQGVHARGLKLLARDLEDASARESPRQTSSSVIAQRGFTKKGRQQMLAPARGNHRVDWAIPSTRRLTGKERYPIAKIGANGT